MDVMDKLTILAEAARFDAACTSSGARRGPKAGRLGCTSPAGCCHSFTADGRCITLLKVLMSNACSYDCAYCVNRSGARCQRATFAPHELAQLTVDFYRRNYIEGLFLSSGVLGTPDATSERMIACLRILRDELRFNGYVHAKVIPGTSPKLVEALGRLADRLSVNLELPSAASLTTLCPQKGQRAVLAPMRQIAEGHAQEGQRLLASGAARGTGIPSHRPQGRQRDGRSLLVNANALTLGRSPSPVPTARRRFAPAGQSTQLIIGATPESDHHVLRLSQALYQHFDLKRIFFSAYMPMIEDARLPERDTPVPLRREHRLYQADWLMRYYGFSPDELATPTEPWLDLDLDPKLAWALRNIARFPVEVMDAPLPMLLRVPGVGPVGARRIMSARRAQRLDFGDLRRLGVTLKRARHFLTCSGVRDRESPLDAELIRQRVVSDATSSRYNRARRAAEGQLSLF
ncbi:putative DNA modification/repair radical SAM protein [Olsenella profusa]|uniref:Putative DNA modification/repair radical SAM protein n=1 Tax=Olsenella profusa F0195 TaxID=1125712 RepID=U2V826_9ACTN|nr:putative DNA modification/repair radical SAM protein [Olsenella profusa]ERL08751.1 putative DNA modification/repair radical SAM protein [Olsenella profusa F0195]